MKKVLILGCGPAGLMAAAAAEQKGYDPLIVSKKRKSEMYGAQYLHRPIPGFSPDKSFDVSYALAGTMEGYREKVYGPDQRIQVSPEDYLGDHKGWDIRETYNNLWNRYMMFIMDVDFKSPAEVWAFLGKFTNDSANPISHFLSTIPAHMLCMNPAHQFPSQKVWAVGDAPERGIFSPITTDFNTVVCSGDPDDSWYRKSNILGYNTVEWSARRPKPPLDGVADVLKPLSTNCDCLPMVHRLGRYGKWEKGILSDSAYYDVQQNMEYA